MLFIRLSSSYFFYFAILGLVSPFLSVFLDGKGFSSLELGEIFAIITATKIVAPSLWAVLADKTGQQLGIIRLGAFLALLSFSVLFWLNDYWPITFCLALFTLFWTAILPQLEVVTLTSIRRSGKIYGRIRLWGSLGFIALAIITGQAISYFSYQAFSVVGLVILLLLFFSTLTLKQPRTHRNNFLSNAKISDKLFHPSFVIFFLAGALLQVSFGPYYGFFALFLRDLSYPDYAVGLLLSIGVVAEIIIFIYAGTLFKYFSLKGMLISSLAITAVRWLLVAQYGDVVWLLALTQLTHAASFGLYHSASMLFISNHFDKNQQSRGQAIYIGGVYGVGGAIGAYLAGVLWLDGMGATTTFEVAAATALMGAFLMLFMKNKEH